jgi:hypothetical protein
LLFALQPDWSQGDLTTAGTPLNATRQLLPELHERKPLALVR